MRKKRSVSSSYGRKELESGSVHPTGLLSCTEVELEQKHRKWSMGTFLSSQHVKFPANSLKVKSEQV